MRDMPPSSRIKPGRAEAFHAPEVVHFDPSESDHRWCTLGDRGHLVDRTANKDGQDPAESNGG
jgi:hypothetical protein